MKKIRTMMVAFALLVTLGASPVMAQDCATEISQLSQAVAGMSPTDVDLIYEVNYILSQASTLCSQGDEAGALALITQVKLLLGIQ